MYCVPLTSVTMADLASVGGKNASLGEMMSSLTTTGVRVPDGFAITVQAYQETLDASGLTSRLRSALDALDTLTLTNLSQVSERCRALILEAPLSDAMQEAVTRAYHSIRTDTHDTPVAVRSSATAEDLPAASFAGQHDSFLNVTGVPDLLIAVKNCYASVFNARAIKYRIDNGVDHLKLGLSVGVQRMVRTDTGSAGVAFTIDPESGSRNVVYLTSTWGSGELIVQGAVVPDEIVLFKPSLRSQKSSILRRRRGSSEPTTDFGRNTLSISDSHAEALGRWCCAIEDHYGMPMDIEWARDGLTNELFVVQARPETVRSQEHEVVEHEYHIADHTPPLLHGTAVGRGVTTGTVRLVQGLADAPRVHKGDIIVAETTNPDWNAMLRNASCIVTNKGGRTSHASIVARELGIHAVVGTESATTMLHDGQTITVACAGGEHGDIFDGRVEWTEEIIRMVDVPTTRTKPMLIVADPEQAFRLARYPAAGVGLMRMEFAIANTIRVHPMALVSPQLIADAAEREEIDRLTAGYEDKRHYFIESLVESIGITAAAFFPRPVILRMSDFKTNEYARLLGGSAFEPVEENPMLGFRGASRYYHPRYREGFALECEAVRIVRDEKGLTNIIVMIPFCRTIDEGRKVIATMKEFGLNRGTNGLQIYVMAEIPSNVILAEQFAALFDGFSIGSNDLTQLVLGVDRDSETLGPLFNESNAAVTSMLADMIGRAKRSGRPVGLCGQAPSDHPEFAQFLVERRIDSISFTPDALINGIRNIATAEVVPSMRTIASAADQT